MVTASVVLLVFALVLFVLSAVGVPSPPRINLMGAGLACWVGSELLGRHW